MSKALNNTESQDMTTINMTVKQVENLAKSSPKFAGSFNLFFNVTDRIGIKATLSEQERDDNYNRQALAAKHGLGPDVFGKINFSFRGETMFAYFTEIVKVITGEMSDEEYTDFHCFYNEHFEDLVEELEEKTGFYFYDAHKWNTGIKNGRLVCIDFDDSKKRFNEKTLLKINMEGVEVI